MKIALALFLVLAAVGARADFLSGATGFTTLKNPQTGKKIPGIIHFAVLDQKGGQYGDSWATRLENLDLTFERGVDAIGHRSPVLDFRARYLYLYQVTNDGKETPFESASIRLVIHPSRITSWGGFCGAGFADRKPGSAQWNEVSSTNTFGLEDPQAPPGAANLIVYYPRVVLINGPKDPGVDPREVLLGANAVRASWVGGELVLPGKRSTIFGFTSNYPPGMKDGHVVYQCGLPGQPPCP